MSDAAAPAPVSPWRHPVVIGFAVATLAYVAWVMALRFHASFEPWLAETDTKQVTYQFYRYYVEGAFPRGHLLTDYTSIYNSPPFFQLIMAPMTTFIDPIVAGNVLHIILFIGALVALYFCVAPRTHPIVGLAAVVLLAHNDRFFKLTAGGYARSFGPTLILLFLAAWLSGRRRLALFVLVLQAGIYPSVMMPSALAFGVFSLWQFWRERDAAGKLKLRPMVELAVTAVLCFLLAKSQDLRSPAEWGSPVSYEDALKNPAWKTRMPFVPLPPLSRHTVESATGLFTISGSELISGLGAINRSNSYALLVLPWVAAALVLAVKRRRYPIHVLLLFAAAFASFLLARALAFKLHIPHRPISHGWPYILAAGVPLLCGLAAQALLPQRRQVAAVVGAAAVLVPLFLFCGSGDYDGKRQYRSYKKDAALYLWLRKNTPIDAQFAGNFQILDEIPLFSWRQPYVNWKLAHPFRDGYWKQIVDRTNKMYRAYYATDLEQVLSFAKEADIDYFIVDRSRFKELERGDGQLFEPLRSMVKPYFDECKRTACVFNPPPKGAVVFTHRNYDVVDLQKLQQLAALPTAADVPAAPDASAPDGSAVDAAQPDDERGSDAPE